MARWSSAWATVVVLLLSALFSKGALAAPSGQVNGVDSLGVVSGWARDTPPSDAPVDVHFYVDYLAQGDPWPGFVGQAHANLPGAQGSHGFKFAIPSEYFDGAQHVLYVYAVSSSGAPLLTPGIPFTLTTGTIGKLESIDPGSGRVRGWARTPSAGVGPVSLDVYVVTPTIGPELVFTEPVLANAPRADLNVLYRDDPGDHGFSFTLPTKYFDGVQRTLYVYPNPGQSNPALTGAPMTFSLPALPIIGDITSVVMKADTGDLEIRGWACQVGVEKSIPVVVYAGASAYFSEGSPLTGTFVPSEYGVSISPSAIRARCGLGIKHNFRITVAGENWRQHQGLPLFVHGLRVKGNPMNAALGGSGKVFFPLDRLNPLDPLEPNLVDKLVPGVPSVFTTPALLKDLLASASQDDSPLLNSAAWEHLVTLADSALNIEPNPYYGSRVLPDPAQPAEMSFKEAIERDLGSLPFLALSCQVLGGPYCDKGIELLWRWAVPSTTNADVDPDCSVELPLRAGVQLFCPKPGLLPDKDPAFQAGLNIARYLSSIVESYQLLAIHMTREDRNTVASWVRELGYTIKKSSLVWNTDVPEEGPNNHLGWHNYGMVIAGLMTSDDVPRDNDLVAFALTDPSNSQTYAGVSYARNYKGMVTDAIREFDNTSNIFRDCYDSEGLLLRTGEIWDRFRHYSDARPDPHTPAPCVDPSSLGPAGGDGFYYSLFGLLGMTYTAHLASNNGLTNDLTPLWSFADPNAPGVPTLFNALDFYSHEVVENAVDGNDDLTGYVPYRGESVCQAADFGSFIVGKAHVPEDMYSQFDTGKLLQTQLQEAQHVCRDDRDPSHPFVYFDFDDEVTEGMPPLYLLLVHHQY